MKFNASVAQLAERRPSKADVAGSLPVTCSIYQIVDSLLETQTDWFISLVLTPHSQEILKRVIPPAHPWVKAHHMTMAFKPAIDRLEHYQAMVGQRLRIKVTGVAQDEKGQAVAVQGPSDNPHPHITISCADGVSPAYSNQLVAGGVKPITPLWLDGIVEMEPLDPTFKAAVAQPAERLHGKQEATGAEPVSGSSLRRSPGETR